jgi:hypothetical protein
MDRRLKSSWDYSTTPIGYRVSIRDRSAPPRPGASRFGGTLRRAHACTSCGRKVSLLFTFDPTEERLVFLNAAKLQLIPICACLACDNISSAAYYRVSVDGRGTEAVDGGPALELLAGPRTEPSVARSIEVSEIRETLTRLREDDPYPHSHSTVVDKILGDIEAGRSPKPRRIVYPLRPVTLRRLRPEEYPTSRSRHEALVREYDGRHQVGGLPVWIQTPKAMKCPGCGNTMAYFSTVTSQSGPEIEIDILDNGVLYSFLCVRCQIIGSVADGA